MSRTSSVPSRVALRPWRESTGAAEDGAALTLRSDASASELAQALRAGLKLGHLARDLREAREDLRRHAALVLKDDLTAAYNRRYFERLFLCPTLR